VEAGVQASLVIQLDRIKKIKSQLPEAMPSDRHAIGREIRRIKRLATCALSQEKAQKKLFHLEKRLGASVQKRSWRKQHLPRPIYNETLPIYSRKDDIIDSIRRSQVVIIAGETGSGKTTQIPKFCLAAGRGIDGKIGCTQPRRIAATTVAHRIAEELGEQVGKSIGYKIRFKDRTSPTSFIKIMTDGILLAETQNDPNLYAYDTIIVDEAHERSLNIDFVLGILKTLLQKRKDLKLIITSATIDTKKFSEAFNNAPVIEVSGRMYPVEIQYFPIDSAQTDDGEQTHVEMAVRAADRIQRTSGDILVFMPTEQDIRETCEILEGRNDRGWRILPLYARLSASEQARVFSRTRGRKIIVATNIAETSITLPGIKYVIDTGLARISQYTPRSRITSLPVLPVSKSSADQRKGRCGRVQKGVCIRLFSEEDYNARPLFTQPEILRSNLAEVILRMIALQLGDVHTFPFIDKPAIRSIKDGFDLLSELGAIASEKEKKPSRGKTDFSLTGNGRLMAKMPIDPRLSRMLIEAQKEGCLEEICVIASALSIRDPRERPAEKTGEADRVHAAFADPESDFITLLNIWNRYQEAMAGESGLGGVRKFCKPNYFSFKRMREWGDIHAQISAIVKECRMKMAPTAEPRKRDEHLYAAIHKSILSGFLSNIAVKKEKNIYTAAKGREAMIFPGSGLFNTSGPWIVGAEMIETSRLFARTTANIDSNWLEALGRAQCKYTYTHPHWERSKGEVIASEKVSLYGLIIVDKRPVSYGRINPAEASDILIQSALVDGDVKKPFLFMEHNKKLINEITDIENRLRRRDLLASEQDMFDFYRERLPNIYDIRSLKRYLEKKGTDRFLLMSRDELLRYLPNEKELALFPDTVTLGDDLFKCEYRFSPGNHDDGVTVDIPSTAAPAVPPESLDWLVPGFFKEKVTAMIKGLSKSYRRKLVPIAETVEIIAKEIPTKERYLSSALSAFIYQCFGIDIPASAWPVDDLPEHLKMRMSLTDPEGEEITSGRDKTVLRQNFSTSGDADEFETAKGGWEKFGITKWNFEDLPDAVKLEGRNGAKRIFYPGLEADDRNVNLRLFQYRDKAMESHKAGVCKLFANHFSKDLKYLRKKLILPEKSQNKASYFGGARQFEKKIYESVIKDLFRRDIRTEKGFYAHAGAVSPSLYESGERKLSAAVRVLDAYHESRSIISELASRNHKNHAASELFEKLRAEITRLVPETFLDLYDSERLGHLERYVKAISIRAQRAVVNLEKDREKAKKIKPLSDSLNELLKKLTPSASDEKRNLIEEFFWLIEEYKISLFAQEMKTHVPVSRKRLDEKLKEIERIV